MRVRIFALSVSLIGSLLLIGCNGGGGSGNPPDRGFDLAPVRIEISQTTSSQIERTTIMRATGWFLEPQGTTQGTLEYFAPRDIGPVLTRIPNARVPGRWRFQYVEAIQPGQFPCVEGIQTVERNVHIGEREPLYCHAYVFPITVNPKAIDVTSPPSTIDVEAEGVSDTYGSPQVATFDEFGSLKFSVSATAVNLGKGQIRFTLPPNLSTYTNGVYQLTVSNITASGRWETVAAGELSLYGNTPPPAPNPPDPCSVPAPCLF
ncbi:MAG: hypothetical protein KF756_13385 [Acidobacteria bacterium]|nr:hypothetical protein [Acidobacteriota bacterium]